MKNVGVNSFKLLKNRTVVVIAAFAMLLSIVVPTLAMAAQVTERSIELSSSSADADNVTYTVNFTPAANAGAFVIDFCSDSPLIEAACATPGGFSVAGAESATSGFTGVSDLDVNTLRVTGTITQNTPVSVELTGINNPTAAGSLYARIVTYLDESSADDYTSTVLGANDVDSGSVAISINDTIGVSGAVLESMTFCAAKVSITANCANADTPGNAPVLRLGETVGSVIALVPGTLSTGSIYTQISTNALGGAVISLKSGATNCGGLVRAGAPTSCDITPALQAGVAGGQAKFGVLATAEADTGTNPTGTFQTVPLSGYNGTTYALNYADQNASGVTSTYGDPFLNTAGAPANNKNMKLTFGVSVNNATPAGLYSADLGLIATGKF